MEEAFIFPTYIFFTLNVAGTKEQLSFSQFGVLDRILLSSGFVFRNNVVNKNLFFKWLCKSRYHCCFWNWQFQSLKIYI